MWKIESYNGTQDLSDWYIAANNKKYYNNSNSEMLLNFLDTEDDAKLFLLYYKNKIVGNVATHKLTSLGILGKNAYRIAARVCVIHDLIDGQRKFKSLRSVKHHINHDHVAAQFLFPACIEYAGRNNSLYISTHVSKIASQRAVHERWAPYWQSIKLLDSPIELEYRGTFQSFWKLNVDYFYKTLKEQRWPEAQIVIPI
jgi:hypothetical protein